MSTTKRKITSSCRPPWRLRPSRGKLRDVLAGKKSESLAINSSPKKHLTYQSSWFLKTSSDGEILKNWLSACLWGAVQEVFETEAEKHKEPRRVWALSV